MIRLRPVLQGGGAIIALTVPSALAAQDVEVRVSAEAGVESNPYLVSDNLDTDDDGLTAMVGIAIEPSVYFTDERSTFRLNSSFRLREYEGERSNESIYVNAGGTNRISERTSLTANASFGTSRSAVQDIFRAGTPDLLDPVEGIDPEFPEFDPTLAGVDRRTYSYGARASLTRQLTERDAVSFGVDASQTTIDGDFGNDYRRAGGVVNYARQLTERTSLQSSVTIAKNDLLGQSFGDGVSVTPLIGVAQQINEQLSWSASAGLTYSEIDDGRGGNFTNTDWAGFFQLCRRAERSALCANAARDARATTFGGLTTSTSASLAYNFMPSQVDRIRLGANYRRSKRILSNEIIDEFGNGVVFPDDTFEFWGVNAGYSRNLTDRLYAFSDVSYTDAIGGTTARDGNFRAAVGLTYRFGGRR